MQGPLGLQIMLLWDTESVSLPGGVHTLKLLPHRPSEDSFVVHV
jgi:hypothetical protein